MAEIGKSLVFYLNYFAEMQRLYEERESIPGINPHDDPELRKKIEDVGHAAGVEARCLLEACVSDLKRRLLAVNDVEFASSRDATVEANWEIRIDVRPRKPKRTFKMTWIGITLDDNGLIPWVWRRGGMAAEVEIRSCFTESVKSYGSKRYSDWASGTVCLETTTLPWESAQDFAIDGDDIIKRTQQVCEAIDPEFIKKLISRP